MSFAFRLYLEVASGTNPVFGVLGGAMILLIWLYLLSTGLLVGASSTPCSPGVGGRKLARPRRR